MELFYDKYVAREHTARYYMPESLCWHVLRSVFKGLLWLHTGQRFFCSDTVPEVQEIRAVDDDWFPILHGAVKPENIFFQLPRGQEKYGPCKLGNFSKAFISGKQCTDRAAEFSNRGPVVASLRDGKMANWDSIRFGWNQENPIKVSRDGKRRHVHVPTDLAK